MLKLSSRSPKRNSKMLSGLVIVETVGGVDHMIEHDNIITITLTGTGTISDDV